MAEAQSPHTTPLTPPFMIEGEEAGKRVSELTHDPSELRGEWEPRWVLSSCRSFCAHRSHLTMVTELKSQYPPGWTGPGLV